ncbi:ankyrin repeat domain-containing protein 12 isoform X2 [Chrysoperla carnea]|uniref:ankyrin repeat domain-containing protein 12 isoform X2 n=1 Tax=Chrysoperla carnea TaxID=189513 RepID=UPI001D08F7D2|nr:ankyrin repeat domain-containing protein 12 isoform X2 [Chrysoperla carnea]
MRPRGSGGRAPPVTPMSERQQMALLMQMTNPANPSAGGRSPSGSTSRTRDRNERGETPLHLAAIKGDVDQVSKLLSHKADPNATDFAESGASQRQQGRVRDEKKLSESKKCLSPSETMDTPSKNTSTPEDIYEFKSVKETSNSPDPKATDPLEIPSDAVDPLSIPASQNQLEEPAVSKRPFAELSDPLEDIGDEETKRKKRKDSDAGKDSSSKPLSQTSRSSTGPTKTSTGKPGSSNSNKSLSAASKSPCPSPKPTNSSDVEVEDGKVDLKVPPLKIVIPQSTTTEQESGSSRNGKSSSQRSHQALPYVVASSNNSSDSTDKDGQVSGTTSPTDSTSGKASDEKKESFSGNLSEDQKSGSGHHQRVLRSSHRSSGSGGNTASDRASNNSSPQLQRSHSPSPSASPATPSSSTTTQVSEPQTSTSQTSSTSKSTTSDAQAVANTEHDNPVSNPTPAPPPPPSAPVELHPRKRKLRPNKEQTSTTPSQDNSTSSTNTSVHPHEQPITNCYQLFLNIRKQIERRRKNLFPVQPKPPQGFKDYLMNRCSYVLARNAPPQPTVVPPATVPGAMRDIYVEQEKERYKLRMQHVIEKEKLVLSVEQEILRVHGLAARTLANQTLPFSVCTVLRDEEVYNVITPEQEEKDRNARSRYNGRLFLSWLQDVDDKWEKIKEAMLLRHHNEAESLHAVQRMDWEWKLKELSLCEYNATPQIDELHVPMVHVSDDFDLLPA